MTTSRLPRGLKVSGRSVLQVVVAIVVLVVVFVVLNGVGLSEPEIAIGTDGKRQPDRQPPRNRIAVLDVIQSMQPRPGARAPITDVF